MTQVIELNRIQSKSIAISQIGISVTSLQIIVPYEHVTVYRIESNRIEIYIN